MSPLFKILWIIYKFPRLLLHCVHLWHNWGFYVSVKTFTYLVVIKILRLLIKLYFPASLWQQSFYYFLSIINLIHHFFILIVFLLLVLVLLYFSWVELLGNLLLLVINIRLLMLSLSVLSLFFILNYWTTINNWFFTKLFNLYLKIN